MNEKEKTAKLLHDVEQESRKLDLLLAESERQAERLKKLQHSSKPSNKPKPSKSPKM
ncbi:hypothetical protein [Spiroplasma ixodetis]|uniref:hypothetical protein n=1 Tax=Spiroplasma ixodetis TaxID=2141 RepID=UPI0025777B36|nr:hypothetical protein [Spiroplasma ixodetis]WJG71439.1 hypothetical protein SIXOD_v1c28840 [Spiroplasma ixodetis Y32]